MNKEILLEALEKEDGVTVNATLKLIFEEMLERKIWMIYNAMESDLHLDINIEKKD